MTMAANNRANARSPGRTPPFILVGLIVLVGFLGFNYWSLSSANSELTAELENVRVDKRDADQKNSEVEKNLESSREELRQVQGKLDETRKQLQERDNELANAKTDYTNKITEFEELRKNLEKCDTSRAEEQKSIDDLKAQKADVERILDEERKKPHICDMASCNAPVRDILFIASKLVGSEAMVKALIEAEVDPSKLMEGINFPAPVVQQPAVNQQPNGNQQQNVIPPQDQQQQGDPNQPQNVNQNQPVGSQGEGDTELKKNEDVKEMNVADNQDTPKQPQNDSDKASGSLVFESDKDKAVGESGKENEKEENEVNKQEDEGKDNDVAENELEGVTGTVAFSTVNTDVDADDKDAKQYDDEEGKDKENRVEYGDEEQQKDGDN